MSAAHALRETLALARADLLERTRGYGFLVFTGFTLWIGYGTYTGHVHVSLGDFVGAWNSAWAGGMMALVANVVLTLAGFWFVRHSVERDVRTRVGPILAATPLSRLRYAAGKAGSHFALLALMAGLLFVAAAAIQLAQRSGAPLLPLDLVVPFALVVLPALWLVAALAVLFETMPVLRGPAGHVAWIFVWTGLAVAAVGGGGAWSDAFGLRELQQSMWQAIAAQHPGLVDTGALNVNIGGSRVAGPPQSFTWPGLAVRPAFVATRLAWGAIACAVVALAAWPFHRFDPDRMPRERAREEAPAARRPARALRRIALARLPLPRGLVGAELRILVAGAGPWWTLVALGLWIAGGLAPPAAARAVLLPTLWLWALPRWSSLGARETRDATAGLVFTGPHATRRVTLAGWAAGALLAAALALPVALRLLAAGEARALAALAAGAAFLPALALVLGAVSGSAKPFEIVYVLLWYLGALNHAAPLDYTGATPGSVPAAWAALALLGVLLAWAAQARRLRA